MATATKQGQTKDDAGAAARGLEVHKRSIVIDGQTVRGVDPPEVVGGVTARVITICGSKPYDDTKLALQLIATQLDFIDFYADRLLLVRTADDIERAKREGKLGLIFNFQGIAPIGVDLSLVRVFHELGLRSMQPTYMEHSLAGSGCLERNDLGLTSFGRQLIRAMERIGVLLDLAHVGRRTSMEALAYARRPVVFSHCNPAALFECPRNITDEEIKACAATGGVVGITPSRSFYVSASAPQPTLDDMVDHVAYVAELVGIDHVGVSHDTGPERSAFKVATDANRDFQGEFELPTTMRTEWTRAGKDVVGFQKKADFPNFTVAMAKRGFSDEDIAKVIGGNFLRVFREAWPPRPARAASA
jgi:membrane dipeptidase